MTVEKDRPDSKSLVDLAQEADFCALQVSPSIREAPRGAERETAESCKVLVALWATWRHSNGNWAFMPAGAGTVHS
jgi:hypothetical protein